MAEGGKLGTAYYELVPSMRGAQQQISEKLNPAATAAGGEAGASIGSTLLGGLKKFAGPIAVLAAGFSVSKIVKDSEKSFMDLVGATNALQRIAGGTKEQVSGMRGAMQLAGVDANGASGALTIFSKNLGNAAADSDKAAAMQDKLGVAFLDAAGHVKPMAEILPGLADKFKSMPDGAEKTALATQLFGRSGAQMLPFLNKGSEGIGQLTDKAKQMGLVIDDVSAKSFGAAKVSAREYSMSLDGLKATLGGNLLPITTAFGNLYRQTIIPVIQAASGFLAAHRGQFLAVGNAVQAFADRTGAIVTGLFALFTKGDYTGALGKALGVQEDSAVVDVLFRIRDAAISFGESVKQAFGGIAAAVGPTFAQLGPALSQLLPPLIQIWSSLSPVSLIFKALQPVLPQIVSLVKTLASALSGALLSVVKALVPILTQLATILTGVLAQVITALVPVITALVGVITQLLPVFLPLINAVLGLVGPILSLISPLLSLIGPILQPLIGLLVTLLQPILALVQPIIGLLVPALQFLVGVLTAVISWITEAIAWFVRWVTGNQEAGAQFQAVWSAVMGFFAGIGQFFANVWNGLIGGIGNMVNSVVSFFTSLPGKIGAVFAGAGQWLWDAGVNIVNGLIDGIKSMAGSIGKWFLSIIPDWIKAPFMAALGIHSPSRVFKQYGEFTMQGFIDGLSSMQSKVQATADQVGTLTGPAGIATTGTAAAFGAQVTTPISIRMYDRDPRIVGAQIGRGIEGALHG
ncbi:hypothetical protein ACIPY5_12080 [Microbacterium sp. NPDC089698]|uniref:phage tail protein n=2 Tax=Micrococcales TaxID=85006 RepID=UPI0038214AB2